MKSDEGFSTRGVGGYSKGEEGGVIAADPNAHVGVSWVHLLQKYEAMCRVFGDDMVK